MVFSGEHWRQIHFTSPLERLNGEIRRRSDATGISPKWESVIRLIGAILIEKQDEWTVARRYSVSNPWRKFKWEQLPLTPRFCKSKSGSCSKNSFYTT